MMQIAAVCRSRFETLDDRLGLLPHVGDTSRPTDDVQSQCRLCIDEEGVDIAIARSQLSSLSSLRDHATRRREASAGPL
jgi:hypothetical protein